MKSNPKHIISEYKDAFEAANGYRPKVKATTVYSINGNGNHTLKQIEGFTETLKGRAIKYDSLKPRT